MNVRWQLDKNGRTGRRVVRCVETPHALGVELRVIVDPDDLRRSEVFRDRAAAEAATAEWRAAFEQKGWGAAAPRFRRDAIERALALTRDAQARVPGTNGMGHVLSYRLKVMREALEVAIADDVTLDAALREKRLVEAMRDLARAERGPEGQAFVRPILKELT